MPLFAPPAKVDGRRREAQRWRAMVADISALVGSELDPLQTQLVHRLVGLMIMAEAIERCIIIGTPVEWKEQVSITEAIITVSMRLGIRPPPPQLTHPQTKEQTYASQPQ